MSAPRRQLHLNANVLASGRHDAAWRLEDNPNSVADIDAYIRIAQLAERGTFDAFFLADGPQLNPEYVDRPWHALEPTVLLAGIATATTHIGLVATASTTFNEPYNIARRYASLDHVSKGRAAWNIVTSQSEDAAANFGLNGMPGHSDRYERAEEFVDIVVKLWDSFEDEALVPDQATGRYADPSRVHTIDHVGKHFSVRGPLNVPRAPQGRPVIVQAGDSPASRQLGSRWADALFTVQRTYEEALEFYAQLKGLAQGWGRDPDSLVILPGLYPVVGSTEAEAWARKDELDGLLDFDDQRVKLAGRFNVDPDRLHLDKPIPRDIDVTGAGSGIQSGFVENILREAWQENLTVRQLLGRNPFGGHRVVVGTPEQIADNMELWFTNGAADGFNLNMDAYPSGPTDSYPSGLELFVDHVVPELRRRGLFRREYAGTTLRSHLGLDRPASQYARQTAAAGARS